jgi:NACalpha-BTF3-like transcription factor
MTSVCRKKKAVHKAATTDDKRLQNTLKRLGVNVIPGIEEVMIMKDDNVIHFTNPKGMLTSCFSIFHAVLPAVFRIAGCILLTHHRQILNLLAVQASIGANTYVVSGQSQERSASPLSLAESVSVQDCSSHSE